MGRAKQRMELIRDEKSRLSTYKKRKNGLKKKAHELKTLCDVDVCLLIYGPKGEEAELWPENDAVHRRLIESYRNQPAEERRRRGRDLSNFFEDRNQKIEDELAKLRKKNDEAVYPTWDDRYNTLPKEQLEEFQIMLEHKILEVKSRIELINATNHETSSRIQSSQSQSNCYFVDELARTRNVQIGVLPNWNVPIYYPPDVEIEPQLMMAPNSNYNSAMSNGNFIGNSMNGPPCFDPMGMVPGMINNAAASHPCPPLVYNGYMNAVPPMMPPYLPCMKMGRGGGAGSSSLSQAQPFQIDQVFRNSEFQMNDQSLI
ncbi:hypothetical protein NMG60_11001139 [Bertholletia excelsa]